MSKTPRQRVSAWMREEMAGKSEVMLPDVVDRMVDHFKSDPEFVRAFLTEMLRPIAYSIAQQVCAGSRDTHLVYDDSPPAPAIRAAVRPKWWVWQEHAGSRHVLLPEMTSADLLLAATEREKRGEVEYRLAGLWRKLAAKLGEGQLVGEVFDEEAIDRWARLLKVQVKVTIPVPTTLNPQGDKAA